MPRIVAVSHAEPPYAVAQSAVREAARALFAERQSELERLLEIFARARIECRQFLRPLEWYLSPQPAEERQRIYREEGLALLESAARSCLERAACDPQQIDQIICVSSTGLATPTLDAYLINRLGLRPTTSRLPLWGLGCAAGAAGLARAADYCRAWPERRVLLVALECCSLTFLHDDLSNKNLVACALFGDGAAAALLAGDAVAARGPQLLASRSHLFPDSYRIMGWDFVGHGMQLVLSPQLPLLVRNELAPLVTGFLADCGLRRDDLDHYLTHPGGARVLDAYAAALQLAGDELDLSAAVLRDHGNVSSVTILLVLERWLATAPAPYGYGLLSAFGPGFSAELSLLRG